MWQFGQSEGWDDDGGGGHKRPKPRREPSFGEQPSESMLAMERLSLKSVLPKSVSAPNFAVHVAGDRRRLPNARLRSSTPDDEEEGNEEELAMTEAKTLLSSGAVKLGPVGGTGSTNYSGRLLSTPRQGRKDSNISGWFWFCGGVIIFVVVSGVTLRYMDGHLVISSMLQRLGGWLSKRENYFLAKSVFKVNLYWSRIWLSQKDPQLRQIYHDLAVAYSLLQRHDKAFHYTKKLADLNYMRRKALMKQWAKWWLPFLKE